MKDLKMKAESYTEGKINEILTQAVVQAYMDGYRDGYNDGENSIPTNLLDNQTEFVDLGLPSGTLWAKDYEKKSDEVLYLPHSEANCLNIPTKEQWEELEEICQFELVHDKDNDLISAECIGPNGNVIIFEITGMITSKMVTGSKKYAVYFWLKDESDNSSKDAIKIRYTSNWKTSKINVTDFFSGYKLPVRLVKQK